MKSCLRFVAVAALFAAVLSPVCSEALDPHDSQGVDLLNGIATTSITPAAVLTLTSHAVNSGTNSYVVTALVDYYESAPGRIGTITLTVGTNTLVTKTVGGGGSVTLRAEVESVAASTAVAIKYAAGGQGDKLQVAYAHLDIVGLAGVSQ